MASNASVYRYFFERPGSDALLFRVQSGPETVLLYQYDARGNVTHVSDRGGQVLEAYLYDADGLPFAYDRAGNYLGHGGGQDNRYLWHGASAYQWLSGPELYGCRARMYLHTHGRWLQPDPSGFAGGDLNLYRYCANDPVSSVDASGLITTIALYTGTIVGAAGHTGISTSSDLLMHELGVDGFYEYGVSLPRITDGSFTNAKVTLNPDSPDEMIIIDTTLQEEKQIDDYITDISVDPGMYSIIALGGKNCATFVRDALRAANIETSFDPIPTEYFWQLRSELKNRILFQTPDPLNPNDDADFNDEKSVNPFAEHISLNLNIGNSSPVGEGSVEVGQDALKDWIGSGGNTPPQDTPDTSDDAE